MENVQTIPPPYVVRTVLIYSRHAGQLQFNPSEAVSVSTILQGHLFVLYFLLKSEFSDIQCVSHSIACSSVLLQKMLQSPYFFFDVVYLHNGVEDQAEETSWRVSGKADDKGLYISTP